MLLMIDNYDSFTYNLVQYLQVMDTEVQVVRSDVLSTADCVTMEPDAIIISPGPGSPRDAGISVPLIRECSGRIPILGVCLGHQCIGAAFGGRICKASRIMHGKVSVIDHNGQGIFSGLRSPLKATRYHSLVIEKSSMPDSLEVTATSEDGEIMGVRHCSHPTIGIQFHPESILTTSGKRLLANFLKMARETAIEENTPA